MFLYTSKHIFPRENQVTIALNAKYITIHRSPRALMQLNLINSQIFPNSKKFLAQVYVDVMKEDPFGYIVIALTAHCPEELKIRMRIFPNEETIVYCED